jgi:hypothetical protein
MYKAHMMIRLHYVFERTVMQNYTRKMKLGRVLQVAFVQEPVMVHFYYLGVALFSL